MLLAKKVAKVIVSDINDSQGLLVAKEIGGDCFYLHLDVKEEDDWKKAISTILKKFGKLNILVNNAGITGFQEGLDRVLAVRMRDLKNLLQVKSIFG